MRAFLAFIFACLLTSGLVLAIFQPWIFSWYTVDPNWSLGLSLLLVGLSININELYRQDVTPDLWIAGFFSSVVVWPVVAFSAALLAASAGAKTEVLLGLLTMAACPPGSASNLVPTMLSTLPVAPVVLLCTVTTLLSAWTFPFLLSTMAGIIQQHSTATTISDGLWEKLAWDKAAPIAGKAFWTHGVYSLLLPFIAGFICRQVLFSIIKKLTGSLDAAYGTIRAMSLIAPIGILVTATNKLALNSGLTRSFPTVVAMVLAVHLTAYLMGYLIASVCGCSLKACRIACIQAGARNPAVGFTVAMALLGTDLKLAIAPMAVSIWAQNLIGSCLAARWSVHKDTLEIPLKKRQQPPRRAKQL